MGNITPVWYQQIDPSEYSIHSTAEMFFNFNMLGEGEQFQDRYEEINMEQVRLRNRVLNDMPNGNAVNARGAMVMISSLYDCMTVIIKNPYN